jgi:hypothetical protein
VPARMGLSLSGSGYPANKQSWVCMPRTSSASLEGGDSNNEFIKVGYSLRAKYVPDFEGKLRHGRSSGHAYAQ